MEPNRFKEFICVLFGHNWTQTGNTKDRETGIILSHYKQCENCDLRIVDESGFLELHRRQQAMHALQ